MSDKCPKCDIDVIIKHGKMYLKEFGSSGGFARIKHWTDSNECLRNQLETEKKKNAELQAVVEKLEKEWPRVYFRSADEKSMKIGFRVASVEISSHRGAQESPSIEIMIWDGDDENAEIIYAPDDFGLYPTREAAEAAKEEPEG